MVIDRTLILEVNKTRYTIWAGGRDQHRLLSLPRGTQTTVRRVPINDQFGNSAIGLIFHAEGDTREFPLIARRPGVFSLLRVGDAFTDHVVDEIQRQP